MRTSLVLVAAFAMSAAMPCLGSPAPRVAGLDRIELQFPDRDTAVVTLVATPSTPLSSTEYPNHRLTLGQVAVPMTGPARVTVRGGQARITFTLRLANVSEQVLAFPLDAMAVRWFALTRSGAPALVVSGIVDVMDRNVVVIPPESVSLFAKLGPVSVSPSTDALGVRALLNVYNPFPFDLVVSRLAYEMTVGTTRLVSADRPGFRLRSRQGSDVMLEDSVPLSDAVTAAAAVLAQQPVYLTGHLILRTPRGEREFPIGLAAAR